MSFSTAALCSGITGGMCHMKRLKQLECKPCGCVAVSQGLPGHRSAQLPCALVPLEASKTLWLPGRHAAVHGAQMCSAAG